MASKTVKVVERIMDANDTVAFENQKKLDQYKIFAINMMASPGSGKTSVILETIKRLSDKYRIGVIEGDTAPVTIDADKIISAGMPAVQINTGGNCHLDAPMVSNGLNNLELDDIDLLIVENVGNLVCPAGFKLGTHANVVVASIPEGDDKPYKYPNIYRGLNVMLVNKIDLMPYIDFNMEYFSQGVEILNPGLDIFSLSCKTGEGFDNWIQWLDNKIKEAKG